jgi:hypothetical protein
LEQGYGVPTSKKYRCRLIGSLARTFPEHECARADGSLPQLNGCVSKQEGYAPMSMIENTSDDISLSDPAAVESLKMLLDYAIAEGEEQGLPVFVLLLKMASLELAKSARREFHPNSSSPSLHDADERVAP